MNNTIYTFKCNKANTLCYVSNPTCYWDEGGSTIIVEYRPAKRLKDRFYVLYCIRSYTSGYDNIPNISVDKIQKDRMAVPKFF